MIARDDIDVLIPTKLHSVRVPNKNFKEFNNGQSLFDIKLQQVLNIFPESQINLIDHVKPMLHHKHMGCKFIQNIANPLILRESFQHLIEQLSRPYILLVRTTTPFINSHLISQFIEEYFQNCDQHSSSVSVIKVRARLFDHQKQPINFSIEAEYKSAPDIKEIYYETAGISIIKREDALRYVLHYAPNPKLFVLDPVHGLDINYPEEWKIAQRIAKSDIFET
jgi:CMP-N-acetylneuraminic acid synthetase